MRLNLQNAILLPLQRKSQNIVSITKIKVNVYVHCLIMIRASFGHLIAGILVTLLKRVLYIIIQSKEVDFIKTLYIWLFDYFY